MFWDINSGPSVTLAQELPFAVLQRDDHEVEPWFLGSLTHRLSGLDEP